MKKTKNVKRDKYIKKLSTIFILLFIFILTACSDETGMSGNYEGRTQIDNDKDYIDVINFSGKSFKYIQYEIIVNTTIR
jgi:hypothetical protein